MVGERSELCLEARARRAKASKQSSLRSPTKAAHPWPYSKTARCQSVSSKFFVCEPRIFDYVEGDATVWENEPLERLSQEGRLSAFRHAGFWQSMDTLRDRMLLEQLWSGGSPPWKVW